MRKKFLTNAEKNDKKYPRNIYIDRSDSKSNTAHLRSLINENEIKNFLIEKNFTIIRLKNLSFEEQIKYFNNAEYIIGLHGAGFANLTFCRSNTRVIEFRMNKTGSVIENLAKTNNLKFDPIICKPISNDHAKQLGHIEIPINILEKKIQDVSK